MRGIATPDFIDVFCGAGGSTDAAARCGAIPKVALNHWDRAIETHNANFPQTFHERCDVSGCNPRRYPKTAILIASPECTHHSKARGKKREISNQPNLFVQKPPDPSEERSRATMWDVPRFAEVHDYRLIVVENVVEVVEWNCFPAWLKAMDCLGYDCQTLFLNSMFFEPTPQSRNRVYFVFTKKNTRKPDLVFTPKAFCPNCSKDVEAVQSWKNPRRPWGEYKRQYLYRCPNCTLAVTPYYHCAFNAIDWSIPCPRVGTPGRNLSLKTRQRIKYGLEKFARPVMTGDPFLVETLFTHADEKRVKGLHDPFPTQTARQSGALCVPQHPFTVDLRRTLPVRGLDSPLSTLTCGEHHALAVPFIINTRGDSPIRAVTDPLAAVTSVNQHWIASYYGNGGQTHPITDPLPVVTTKDRHAVIQNPPSFLIKNYTGNHALPLTDPLGAVTTIDHHGLVEATDADIDECGYRMLDPSELLAAMAFRSDYILIGDKKTKVKLLGNAVTPPVIEWIMKRALEVFE